MATPIAAPAAPLVRRLDVRHARMMVEGHALDDVVLAGTAVGDGPPVIVVGGITASPYPFGGDGHDAWWPALRAPDLLDPARHAIL